MKNQELELLNKPSSVPYNNNNNNNDGFAFELDNKVLSKKKNWIIRYLKKHYPSPRDYHNCSRLSWA